MGDLGYVLLYLTVSVLLVFLFDKAWQYSKRTLTHPIDKRLTTARSQSSVACKHQPCWSLLFDMKCPLGDECPFDHGEDAIEAVRSASAGGAGGNFGAPPPACDSGASSPPADCGAPPPAARAPDPENRMKKELNIFLSTIVK